MATNTLSSLNKVFPICNADGTSFHDLAIKKASVESVVMSLGDKISGDVYYKDNSLVFTMQEYIEYEGVKYVLVNPPTIVREGLVKDNSGLNGMTKYSLVFYHPMYMLGNIPFTDIAVTQDEENYLSQNKTFSWIGNLFDFIEKLNVNLEGTEWLVVTNFAQDVNGSELQKAEKMSDVLSFDKQFISDALKTAFDTWEIPFVIDQIGDTSLYVDNPFYNENKQFVIAFGLPTQEIYEYDGAEEPFVFQFGKGVGLKNNSRNPKNNKIVTRIVGYGSERNIPYGYPQIVWEGNPDWEFTYETSGVKEITIGGETVLAQSYPIYNGIVGGQNVRLIKHPFTRTTLMPSVYADCVNKKVNPYAEDYDPRTEIIDYYDATVEGNYPNPINTNAPSVEIHQFEDEYPHLDEETAILDAVPIDAENTSGKVIAKPLIRQFIVTLAMAKEASLIQNEKDAIQGLIDFLSMVDEGGIVIPYYDNNTGGAYTYNCVVQPMPVTAPGHWMVYYTSGSYNVEQEVIERSAGIQWNDDIDDNGNYVQGYFEITLPILDFDLYASAAITEEMQINMRSGACQGCTFTVQVDWEDYKKNFFTPEGVFDPEPHEEEDDGHVRYADKYPDSSKVSITIIVQKDVNTFGTIMPNIYQQPKQGDRFVILGISLPLSYIRNAEEQLDETAKEYMLENNVYYYDYPLKFDEHFLTTHPYVLSQIKNNNVVRFAYPVGGDTLALYIKQITIKYGDSPLPQYDITLTDDVEIVLNKIGQVTDDVSRMRVQLSELQRYYSENLIQLINERLSKVVDDVAQGHITFQQGLDALSSVILSDEIKSDTYRTGLYTGKGWRIDNLGNAELESLRVRSYLEVVELLINRMQAQEGDTVFSDNDQIDKVERVTSGGETTYILSLKEKYDGYVTSQQEGNILKGIINTLAANYAGVSDYTEGQSVETDGVNKYYTSWMQVVETHSPNSTLGVNQIRVVLYGDEQTPAGVNFAPCQLMNVARWGNVNNPDPSLGDDENARRRALQSFFAISASDGRITKYTGVSKPILEDTMYGTTLGELPAFVKSWSGISSRLIDGRDYLYAQGIVVGDFIKVTLDGTPIVNYVDMGEWKTNTTYLVNEYNAQNLQWETHDVWHLGHKWRCMVHQPVKSGETLTYYEPNFGSSYWALIEGDQNYTMEFSSSNGYSFRRYNVNTTITPYLFFGGIDISGQIPSNYWNWTRSLESGQTTADETWNAQHEGMRVLTLTNEDMPSGWTSSNKAIFTCTVTVNDGQDTVVIENQIIA